MDEHDPLIERLRDLGRQPVRPGTATRHLGAMAAVDARSGWAVKLKVGAAFLAGLLVGGTGLATAGALPAPAQDVAHSTLSAVGLDVPRGHGPARYNNPADCPGGPYRNHGQYVKAHKGDPKATQSRCGMPMQAGTPGGTETPEAPETPEGPDHATVPGGAPGNSGNHGQHGAKSGTGDKSSEANPDDQGDNGAGGTAPATTIAPATTVARTTTTVAPTTSTTLAR